VSSEEAAATVRALSAPEVYSELVHGEGWTPERYETWLGRLLRDVLLPTTDETGDP
jgi:hypothetical protein